MRPRKQSFLPGFEKVGVREFGGTALKGNAREGRPISTRRPVHLVMRSRLATGERSFLRRERARKIQALVYRLAKEKNVKVYRFANSGNHLHLLVLPASRRGFDAYLRALSGLIARITLGVERGHARGGKRAGAEETERQRTKAVRFWDAKPYTRIVDWGRSFSHACRYILQNRLEAIGFIPYQPRGKRRSEQARGTKTEGAARANPGAR